MIDSAGSKIVVYFYDKDTRTERVRAHAHYTLTAGAHVGAFAPKTAEIDMSKVLGRKVAISNIIASDYNHDGRLDLLVSYAGSMNSNVYEHSMFYGNTSTFGT